MHIMGSKLELIKINAINGENWWREATYLKRYNLPDAAREFDLTAQIYFDEIRKIRGLRSFEAELFLARLKFWRWF